MTGQVVLFTQDALDTNHWMVNAIKEMRAEMVIGAVIAKYGVEATLPRAVGSVWDPIIQETIRRSKYIKSIINQMMV